jgi:hypothetical protein
LIAQSRLPSYLFIRNEPVNYIDIIGLVTGETTWQAPPCVGTKIQYIQVVIGGNTWDSILGGLSFGGFPRVDNGGGSTPFYPDSVPIISPSGSEESGAIFGDHPRGFSCSLSFEVCRACVDQNGKIVHIGPCKKWHVMTTDQNLNNSSDPTLLYPDAIFVDTVNNSFPGALPPLQAPDPMPPAG